eukprot:CAMPEP_0185779986 /NCGR_PEP_ID=MMETSP1174-20130828/97607_1 /TAXON_ID=35687 /ORGANISM="Dictyocha speculum, Strain CCMP1381" /LENGTH=70 /DNA_ID=CAMNT_0028469341 /DNA_START=87 /DNA_END=295 /DNA_ORIENTATION=+
MNQSDYDALRGYETNDGASSPASLMSLSPLPSPSKPFETMSPTLKEISKIKDTLNETMTARRRSSLCSQR